MNEREAKLTIINRLLASFPATQSGASDDALDGYEIGIADVPAEFVAIAMTRFLSGKVPGQHLSFPPSPAQLASEARVHWHKRLDDARRERELHVATLPSPAPVQHSPEARERISKMVADFVETHRVSEKAQDRAYWNSVNDHFAPDMSPTATKRRLGLPYTAGDPDSDAA